MQSKMSYTWDICGPVNWSGKKARHAQRKQTNASELKYLLDVNGDDSFPKKAC
jgi:hypothetical protein